MRIPLKAIAILIIAILLISAAYIIFFTDDDTNNEDDEPPKIDDITGDTTGTKGKITTIFVSFSDNIDVTEAIIYYKSASADSWSSTSIINGSADIAIPSSSTENWYYYITVDDAAGNGPVGDPSTDGSIFYTIEVSDDSQDVEHFVFIEEGTRTTCKNCPNVAEILYNLYISNNYRFYYVSIVEDENSKAYDRLHQDYNVYGYPTVYIDGGYKVIIGGTQEESTFAQEIRKAESRDAPRIMVTVDVEYNNNTEELLTDVVVENYEDETYTGRLKVYLTEIRSRWNGYDGKPYRFCFLEYIIDKDISINAGESHPVSDTRQLSDFEYANLDPENLMIIAVVFNSESKKGYSSPPDENPFDAYYSDAADAAVVVEGGNLPPGVGISLPEQGRIHIRGRPILKNFRLLSNTILIGKTTITAYAEDESGIDRVEFYINGELIHNDTTSPYEWASEKILFKKPILIPRKYTIMVKAYDNTGKTSSFSMDVIALRAFGY